MKSSFQIALVLALFSLLKNVKCDAEPEIAKAKERDVKAEPRQTPAIATWIPSRDITRRFPYYLSGYDSESRPIYVVEMGRWDVRSAVEKGGKDLEDLRSHFQQLYYRIGEGGKFTTSEEDFNVPSSVIIMDWADYSLQQLASSRTVRELIKNLGDFKTIEHCISYGYFINVNDAAETIISFARPVMGKSMDRVEVLGTQRNLWMPKLLQKISRSQLPPSYGGTPDFRPVAIYG